MSIQATKFLANVLLARLDCGVRITLVAARQLVPNFTREQFDTAMLYLQETGRVALFHEDDHNKRPALEAGAVRVASTTYHVAYRIVQ